MSDDIRIPSGSRSSGMDLIRQAFGGTQGVGGPAASQPVAGVSSARIDRGAIGGPRGNRILPPDFPLDQLDRRAARGTYLDILV